MSSIRRNESGFSVIEIALVVAAAAIVAAFAVPQIVSAMRSYRINAAIRALADTVNRAKMLAASQNTKTGIAKPGVSLFVNGSINSLRGGVSGSTNRAAIAPSTRLTITGQRDITITGDLRYANPVAASDGSPVANVNAIQNVLGIFTNDGNVNLAPNDTYTSGSGLSLEMNAAVVSFNMNTQNDGGDIEGSIVYTGSSSPKSSETWKLVGSRVQSKINNIGFSTRNIFFRCAIQRGKICASVFPGHDL